MSSGRSARNSNGAFFAGAFREGLDDPFRVVLVAAGGAQPRDGVARLGETGARLGLKLDELGARFFVSGRLRDKSHLQDERHDRARQGVVQIMGDAKALGREFRLARRLARLVLFGAKATHGGDVAADRLKFAAALGAGKARVPPKPDRRAARVSRRHFERSGPLGVGVEAPRIFLCERGKNAIDRAVQQRVLRNAEKASRAAVGENDAPVGAKAQHEIAGAFHDIAIERVGDAQPGPRRLGLLLQKQLFAPFRGQQSVDLLGAMVGGGDNDETAARRVPGD